MFWTFHFLGGSILCHMHPTILDLNIGSACNSLWGHMVLISDSSEPSIIVRWNNTGYMLIMSTQLSRIKPNLTPPPSLEHPLVTKPIIGRGVRLAGWKGLTVVRF